MILDSFGTGKERPCDAQHGFSFKCILLNIFNMSQLHILG